jgi:hypothetical protein
MSTPHWPLFDLRVRTPRVELRPPDEQTMVALVDLADRGVHDPDFVPFLRAWTLEPDGERQRHSLQYYWRCWSGWTVDAWELPFGAWVDGTLVGPQGMLATSFPVTRTFRRVVAGRRAQGRESARRSRGRPPLEFEGAAL